MKNSAVASLGCGLLLVISVGCRSGGSTSDGGRGGSGAGGSAGAGAGGSTAGTDGSTAGAGGSAAGAGGSTAGDGAGGATAGAAGSTAGGGGGGSTAGTSGTGGTGGTAPSCTGAGICGHGPTGIYCARSNGANAFTAWSQWSDKFSDGDGWKTMLAYWATIQFPDVNGDGKADVCGRAPERIYLRRVQRRGPFLAPTLWSVNGFTDAGGWNGNAFYWATIQFPDINGDGKADVCGRGADGISCEVSDGCERVRADNPLVDGVHRRGRVEHLAELLGDDPVPRRQRRRQGRHLRPRRGGRRLLRSPTAPTASRPAGVEPGRPSSPTPWAGTDRRRTGGRFSSPTSTATAGPTYAAA